MTYFQWRRFNFFDIEKDVDNGGLAEMLSKIEASEDCVITTAASCRGLLALGDNQGYLHLLDRRFVSKTLPVFNGMGIKLVVRAPKSGLIVCVSDDDQRNLVKIFEIDKPDKSGDPMLVRTTKLAGSGCPSALAVDCGSGLVAVGLTNGTLLLIRGDLRRDRGVKQKALLSSDGRADRCSVSGLAFRGHKLYVATTKEMLLFDIKIKDRETCTQLDNIGAPVGLTIATEGLEDAHFATARADAIYFFSSEGRGQCYAVEGMLYPPF